MACIMKKVFDPCYFGSFCRIIGVFYVIFRLRNLIFFDKIIREDWLNEPNKVIFHNERKKKGEAYV